MNNAEFKQDVGWADEYPYARKLLFEPALKKVNKSLEDPFSVVKKADEFFFNRNGRRRIHPLDATTQMVAYLMEQGLYKNYTAERRLYTIPTTESVHQIAEIINNINPKLVIEAGAGDGSLSLYLKHHEGIDNIVAIDDRQYGGKIMPDDENSPIRNRQTSKIVSDVPLDQALLEYQPDLVIASWLVNPGVSTGDDVTILRCLSVNHLLWIGDQTGEYTSSAELWRMPKWKRRELTELNALFFTQRDAFATPQAFSAGTQTSEIRKIMHRSDATQGRAVLFSRS